MKKTIVFITLLLTLVFFVSASSAQASDTTPPTAPTNLTATPISSSQINLSWTASTDDVAVTGYNIYHCVGSACAPTVQIATSPTNSYSDTGLTHSTAYTYAVSAYDAAGNESGKSGSASGTTQAPPTSTNPIDNLKPGEWYEVPNSKLASGGVLPNPLPPGYNAPQAIMEEWSGGAYDTKRDRLIIWGGGHGGYGGNEIYTFDINTFSWSRIWGPSPNIPPVGGSCYETYDDGNPVSKHTYEGLEYIPGTDKFWAQGGSRYCGAGGGSNATWEFNLNNLVWERRTDAPSSMLGVVSAYDSVTGHVFQQGVNKFSEYDPLTGTYTLVGNEPSAGWWEDTLAGALDPERRLFVAVGNGYVRVWNLNTKQYSQVTTTGGSAIVNTRGPGLMYDSTLKKIVGWPGGNPNGIRDAQGNTSVYSLDTTTWTWTEHKAATTNTVTPTAPTRVGVFGRFQYIPSKNAFIVVNSIYENVYIYKLSQDGMDTTPPTTPQSLSAKAVSGSQIDLTWQPASDPESAITGYKVYRNDVYLKQTTTTSYSDTGLFERTTYSYQVSAVNGAGLESAKSTPASATTLSDQINIPLNTWVARPLPGSPLSPSKDYPIKDLRLAYNPDDERVYIFGGDYVGLGEASSGRTEMYSYSVFDDKWNLVHPVCLSAGQEQPQRPDEGTFVYDTARKLFWWVPGFSHQAPDNPDNCPSTFVYRQTMSFDPSTTTWTSSNYPEPPTVGSNAVFGQYDPAADTIIRLLGNGQSPYDEVYDTSTNTWSSQTTGGLGSAYIGMAHQAIDVKGRKIYTIDAISNNLWIYDIGTRAFTQKAVPFRISDYSVQSQGQFNMRVFWDSTNEILLFPQINGNHGFIRFHTYKPSTDTWEIEKPIVTSPAGLTLRGNSGIYNPKQNILMVLGGSGTPNPYLFLYRYGNGSGTPPTTGNIINANPTNYLSLLPTLKPGDTLLLESGLYTGNGLPVFNLNGTESQPITIKGPDTGARPIILGTSGQNTVRIGNSSYVIIKNLEIDGRNLGGDPVNGQQTSHHITLENLYIHGFSDDQGTVGISTNQAPVWNWTIRNNIITDGGTGIYLGNSPGTEPFIGGLIEGNLIYDTIGYNIEIKHQLPRPTNIPGMPTTPQKTIIRHNVFSKANNASIGGMARPNLLVGHFPLSGSGQDDRYEIYGNFFYQNPTGEPLFQGEGNVAFYDNLLFNSVAPASPYAALLIAPHNDKPRDVRIFNNTVVSKDKGISVSGGYPEFQQKVIGNAVFAASPISAADQTANITDTYQNASNYLTNPFASLGQFDLFPKPGKLTGTLIDTSSFNTFTDWNKDFNATQRNGTFRGAYAGEGQNPGWLPKLERKPIASGSVPQDTTPPSTPTNPTATAVSSSQINLSWNVSTDNVGVTGYKIYRCQGTGCAPTTQIATSNTNSYSNTGLTASTAYTYAVSAYDAAGNESGQSSPVNATTPPIDGPPPLKGDVQCDKAVDVLDVQALVNCILGTGTCDWGCGNSADVNGDGFIDVLDVQEVVNIILVP